MASDQPPTLWNEIELLSGSDRLHCVSCRPDANAWSRLAIIHGYGDHAGRHSHFMRWIAGRGVACAALDLRGQGRSDGKRGFIQKWDDYLEDVRAFLSSDVLRAKSTEPLFVLGHSHGGLIAAVATERGLLEPCRVRGVILCSPFLVSRLERQRWNAVLARVLNLVAPAMPVASGLADEWMSHDPEMIAESRQDPLCVRTATARWYLGQMKAQREAMSSAGEFRLPLLAIAGSDDPIADPAGTERFVSRAASVDKQFRLYPNQLHELLRESDRQSTFEELIGWMGRLAFEPHA
jgi:alpha-beta hydrolase superfamily lysophospholipase